MDNLYTRIKKLSFMLRLCLIICGMFITVHADTECVVKYYTNIVLYPSVDIETMQHSLSLAVLNAHSEIDIISTIQEKYFYDIPRINGETLFIEESTYKVLFYSDRVMIEHPKLKLGILLIKKKVGEKTLISKKYVFYNKQLIDTVNYTYKKDKLYYVISDLYGLKNFLEADNFKDMLLFKFYEIIELFL